MHMFPKDDHVYTFAVEADCRFMVCSLVIKVDDQEVARETVPNVEAGAAHLAEMIAMAARNRKWV